MNALDWLLVALVLAYALSGYWQGFVTGAFATAQVSALEERCRAATAKDHLLALGSEPVRGLQGELRVLDDLADEAPSPAHARASSANAGSGSTRTATSPRRVDR